MKNLGQEYNEKILKLKNYCNILSDNENYQYMKISNGKIKGYVLGSENLKPMLIPKVGEKMGKLVSELSQELISLQEKLSIID